MLVISKKAPNLYKHHIDYRMINVAISRARKTLDIFYLDNLLKENLIKKDKDNAEFFKFGELYSLDKILKTQKK